MLLLVAGAEKPGMVYLLKGQNTGTMGQISTVLVDADGLNNNRTLGAGPILTIG